MTVWTCDLIWTAMADGSSSGRLVDSGPVRLHEVRFSVAAAVIASDVVLMLFDGTAPPQRGDVPRHRIQFQLGALGASDTLNRGKLFHKGVTWGVSSTLLQFTDAGLGSNLSIVMEVGYAEKEGP